MKKLRRLESEEIGHQTRYVITHSNSKETWLLIPKPGFVYWEFRWPWIDHEVVDVAHGHVHQN